MHISFVMAIIGIVGYMINLRIIDHYIKVKAYQMQEQGKVGRRRSSENRKVRSKAEQRLLKEVPKLKWTMWFGTSMFLLFVIGFVWLTIRLIVSIF